MCDLVLFWVCGLFLVRFYIAFAYIFGKCGVVGSVFWVLVCLDLASSVLMR